MNLSLDTIVAGAGLAGAFAAFVLSKRENVLILDAATPGSGASGIAAGLVRPLMARRARAVWKMEEAVEALDDVPSGKLCAMSFSNGMEYSNRLEAKNRLPSSSMRPGDGRIMVSDTAHRSPDLPGRSYMPCTECYA